MEKVTFFGDEGEEISLFVLEETTVSEKHYLLLTEDEEGDSDAYIFREEEGDEEESVYVPVEDDVELEAILKVFGELLDDAEFVQ